MNFACKINTYSLYIGEFVNGDMLWQKKKNRLNGNYVLGKKSEKFWPQW